MNRRHFVAACFGGLGPFFLRPVWAAAFDSFFAAVRLDDSATISHWLQRGFDPNTVDEQFTPALVLAAREQSLKVVRLLAEASKIRLDAANGAGETALMLLCLRGHADLVRFLLSKGAQVNQPGWTALHYAATNGDPQIIRLLLEANAYIDAESPNGTTPLMMAAQYGTPVAVKLLLEEGADVRLKNQLGLDALAFSRLGVRPASEAVIRAFLLAAPSK
jgi:uncharacterized protein